MMKRRMMLAGMVLAACMSSQPTQAEDMAGYLFAYFRGNATAQEHLFYAISSDGLNYTPLNGGNAVVDFSDIAVSGNVRDPFVLRAEDGTWLMVCTDMRSSNGWSSNRGIVMSKSTDLVNWTHSTVHFPTKYAGTDWENVTHVWAPEVIYDRSAGRYMVYFALKTGDSEPASYDKQYYCYANSDFTDLDGEPSHFFDRGSATIDLTIAYNEDDGRYHAYYKNEGAGGICHISASSLTAASGAATGSQWSTPSATVQQTSEFVEGPCLFRRISDGKWILGYDCYDASPAYFQLCEVGDDFASYTKWGDCPNHDAFTPRHGSILPLTATELYDLDVALGGADELAALRAELQAELASATGFGLSVGAEQAVYNNATANRLQLQDALNSLKVKEYSHVTASYTHDATSLLSAPVMSNIATNSSQHWDGSSSSAYYEQPGSSWSASSWTSSLTYTATLPVGEYVLRVACRSATSVTGTISGNGTTVSIPANGDTGYGINTSGATSFSASDTYANSNKGRGWEWRYIPVTVRGSAKDVTFTIHASASTNHQWFSVANVELLSKSDVEYVEKEKNGEKTEKYVDTNVNITTALDYIISDTTPFKTTGSVNIAHDDAVLILSNVKPSTVISSWLSFVKIFGEQAVNGENCQVKMHGSGAIIMPHGDAFLPLTCFSGLSYSGKSCSSYALGSNGGYMKTLDESQLLNNIRSFRLRRGYMVTFATGTDGWGYSRCFIADDQDLEMSSLPAVLDGKISSYRIFKWNDAQKKGLAASSGDATTCGALNASWTYGWGVGTNMYPDVECVPHKIQKYWPGVAECGKANYSAHMKTDNEPANSSDDNPATVAEVLNYWQDVMRTGMRLLSPSSHDGGYAWQEEFMNAIDERGWRCDILDMHCYWPSASFSSLQSYYNKFKRPIWISEMLWGASWNKNGIFAAVSNWGENSTSNQNANYNGGRPILDQLNGYAYVERYAWWNTEYTCSRLYTDGALTKLGSYYASMESGIGFSHDYEFVPVVVMANPYSLTGKATADGISLSWSDSNGDMMDAIQVQYKTEGASAWQVLGTVDRKDKTSKSDQSYTFECALDKVDSYVYRIVDLYDGEEYPSSTITIVSNASDVGETVTYSGTTYYLGGNVISNGDFNYGWNGWTDGKGNASPAKDRMEVIPVAGPDNSAYMRSYGDTGIDGDASLVGAFTVSTNTPYQYSVWHRNNGGGWQKASLSSDGSTESSTILNLGKSTDEWVKEGESFSSGSYSRFVVKYRWLAKKAKFDKFSLRKLCTTERAAYEDGFTQVQNEAEVFKTWNTDTHGYADINTELASRLSAANSMTHNNAATAKTRYLTAAIALQEAFEGVKTKKTLDSLLVLATTVLEAAHPQYATLKSAIDQATAATTVSGYASELADLREALAEYLVWADKTSLIQNPTFTASTGWTTKAGSYTGGDQRTNNVWGKTCWNAWWNTSDDGTLEVKQTLTDLPMGYYSMSCSATTQPFCITDQHGYITGSSATATTPVLTFERFDSPGITSADVWETLATAPVWVEDGGSLTIGFQSSKEGKQASNPVYTNDNREGWWCATDFQLFYSPVYRRTVKADSWGTLCLPFAVVAGSGVTLYEISGTNAARTELYVTEVAAAQPGVPCLFHSATTSANFYGTSGDIASVAGAGTNGLAGVFKSSVGLVKNGSFILSGGKWYKVTNEEVFNLGDYRAYIPNLDALPVSSSVSAKAMTLIGAEVSGMETVGIDGVSAGSTYRVDGVQVPTQLRGVYIRDGRKFVLVDN